ncbi:MAG: biopolymer transporter ExbD [Planctomycetaceae bacterium]|jgi:biopolymer transport protein ExbD|nr:biopolymer transporter ExbD [Planctomycetaceae bacterium]
MRSPDHLQPKGVSLNLTPMIDVVFLLIIFFLVSNNLIQQDVSIDVDIPSASNVDRITDAALKKITINIPVSGTIYIGAIPTNLQQLKSTLQKHRINWGEDAELRIRTNKNVPYAEIESLLLLAAEAGIWKVSFVVIEK